MVLSFCRNEATTAPQQYPHVGQACFMLGITERLAPYMTPFVGSEQERALLTEYLFQLSSEYARRAAPAARGK